MSAIGDWESYGSATRDPPERQEGKRKRKAQYSIVSKEIKRLAMTEPSELLNVVRRPLSPDVRLEVPANRAEYDEHKRSSKTRDSRLSWEMKSWLSWYSEQTSTRGLTTRGWDGAFRYQQGNRSTLMIAVEVDVSQANERLRAAISWSVCALHCPLGIAMSIREGGSGKMPDMLYYPSVQVAENAFHDAEEEFRRQLTQSPYGSLYGRLRHVIRETYRSPDDSTVPGTLLNPSQSFVIVEDGEFVGEQVPPNLREVVLGDCIPSHILSGEEIMATPDSMVETAVNRMRRRAHFVRCPP
ncbi:hypothetical protein V1525DRAFT_423661 [Lipomyces kononenkoae]|uniref:Uncharacterized protein n=1 Tax=Lipomyces kononenkoae TaxID=34357 RepID=A0ACC3TCW4_LIPKO